jgi:hypothetical protein
MGRPGIEHRGFQGKRRENVEQQPNTPLQGFLSIDVIRLPPLPRNMLESAAWDSAGLPVEVCYKKTVAFVPIADSKATERKPAKGFQANTHRTIPESRKPCPAVALSAQRPF